MTAVKAICGESAKVVVVGAGAMGGGIAQVALGAGCRVDIYDARRESAGYAVQRLRETLAKLVGKGRILQGDADAMWARVSAIDSLDHCDEADLVIEAVVERLYVKREVFVELESVVRTDCILATNTSSISVTAIGAALKHPGRLVGMHFFNPAPLMGLVEIIAGMETQSSVLDTIVETARAWGKSPVRAKSTPGFIVNRCARPFYAEALRVLGEGGGDCATLDALMRDSGGFRMGPFELMDMIGHDVNFAVTRSVFDAFYGDPRFLPSLIQQELVEAGFLGRKSGRGFYDYSLDAKLREPNILPIEQTDALPALHGESTLTNALRDRFEARSVAYSMATRVKADDRVLQVNDAILYPSDGRTATQRASESGIDNTVLLDLALDYQTCTLIALARADQCSEMAWNDVVGTLQAAGYGICKLDDVPGMLVLRTVSMLANEAADAVNQGVCSAVDADVAMCTGVNYPRGPLTWADEIGVHRVFTTLLNLARSYGEGRYRVSPLIRRHAYSGVALRGDA